MTEPQPSKDPAKLKVTFTLTLEEAAAIYPLRDDESDAFLPKLTRRDWADATERARQALGAAIKGGT
jgi:hypothetical protein